MLKKATIFVGFCLLIGIWGPVAHAQTINAASCNAADVQHALNSASSATATVVIPSGTCTWTSQISYSVPANVTSLTIQGQTTVNCTGTAGTSSYSCAATDNTVLVDAIGTSAAMMNINTGGSSTVFRMTGISFEGGSTSAAQPNGFLTFGGSSKNWRVDHCDFNAYTFSPLNSSDGAMTITQGANLNGVVDHNYFHLYSEGNGVRDFGAGDTWGDLSFSQPTNWGSSNFVFVENNDFAEVGAVNDCNDGGREVIRYNTIEANPNQADTGLVQGHQLGQGGATGRDQGCRALEVYHNYFFNPTTGTPQYGAVETGASTALVWGNTISTGYNYGAIMEEIREVATGHSQPNTPNGIGYCGTGSNGTASPWDGNSSAATGYPCIDQTGRGQQLDPLNGQYWPNGLNSVTGTIAWPHQLLEPWYIWDQTLGSGVNAYNAPTWNGVEMAANRDFYAQVAPFNGNSGVGVGLLSARPSSCTAGPGGTFGQSPTGSYGVAYWATDVNSGNGELYVCTSTNTWTPVYTPYTYPHPLVNGSTMESNAPDPPTALIATVQ